MQEEKQFILIWIKDVRRGATTVPAPIRQQSSGRRKVSRSRRK